MVQQNHSFRVHFSRHGIIRFFERDLKNKIWKHTSSSRSSSIGAYSSYASMCVRVVTRYKRTRRHNGVRRYIRRINLPVPSVFHNKAYRVVAEANERAREYCRQIRWPLAPLKSCLVASEFEQIYRTIAR